MNFSFQLAPSFLSSSIKRQSTSNEWLLTSLGDDLECKFRHDPIRFTQDKNNKTKVLIDPTSKQNNNRTNRISSLRLRFKQIADRVDKNLVEESTALKTSTQLQRNKTLVDVPIRSEPIKYWQPDAEEPNILWTRWATIRINTLELVSRIP